MTEIERKAAMLTPIRRRPANGFTLIEMLVVISIIVILIGILVPVIGKVRQNAHAASTQALIASMSAVFQSYHNDTHAYPGIVSNSQLRQPTCNIAGAVNFTGMAAWDVTKMSMSENVFLSVCGGLEPTANPAQFQVNRLLLGQGARSLNPNRPGKLPAYTDMNDAQVDGSGAGHYIDEDGNAANDTVIPDFVDRFPERMPLLILRARAGAPGVCTDSNQTPPVMQYDLDQIRAYTETMVPIGVGRKISAGEYKNATYPNHGLRSVSELSCIGPPPNPNPLGLEEHYPYDLYSALLDPNITRDPASATGVPGNNTPRQKDAFVIISAGIDRVYGTADDITNFGKW
jgi:prepilin-type N-terminal cleavage/methylation domain-containing protein